MDKHAKIYVAGHRGLVGSALMRNLEGSGHANLVTRTHAELDLTDQAAVEALFAAEKPNYVFLADQDLSIRESRKRWGTWRATAGRLNSTPRSQTARRGS